jgi:hypothetical protein
VLQQEREQFLTLANTFTKVVQSEYPGISFHPCTSCVSFHQVQGVPFQWEWQDMWQGSQIEDQIRI